MRWKTVWTFFERAKLFYVIVWYLLCNFNFYCNFFLLTTVLSIFPHVWVYDLNYNIIQKKLFQSSISSWLKRCNRSGLWQCLVPVRTRGNLQLPIAQNYSSLFYCIIAMKYCFGFGIYRWKYFSKWRHRKADDVTYFLIVLRFLNWDPQTR